MALPIPRAPPVTMVVWPEKSYETDMRHIPSTGRHSVAPGRRTRTTCDSYLYRQQNNWKESLLHVLICYLSSGGRLTQWRSAVRARTAHRFKSPHRFLPVILYLCCRLMLDSNRFAKLN